MALTAADSTPVPLAGHRADRRLDNAWLAGVCSGLAAHIGWPVLVFRIGFVLLSASMLVGVAIYLILWLALPLAADSPEAPGLQAARRGGMRTIERQNAVPTDLGAASAVALLGGGLLWLVQSNGWGLPDVAFWPLALGAAGLMLIWWQADRISNRSIKSYSGLVRWFAPLIAHWSQIVRIVIGLLALSTAIALVVATFPAMSELNRTLLVLLIVVTSLLITAAPWIIRVRRSFVLARQEAMVADARADMAAHLHDSVLQTLALIQRQASDPKAVVQLARRQERELRSWLYGEAPDQETFKAALTAVAADVEDVHAVDVDIVVVGDCELSAEQSAIVRASREAMVNAARHSGASRIDVYAEVTESAVEVFVRDRGRGFAVNEIPTDRMGIRGSIIERLHRVGGSATIRSAAGEGTEVKLEMRR